MVEKLKESQTEKARKGHGRHLVHCCNSIELPGEGAKKFKKPITGESQKGKREKQGLILIKECVISTTKNENLLNN